MKGMILTDEPEEEERDGEDGPHHPVVGAGHDGDCEGGNEQVDQDLLRGSLVHHYVIIIKILLSYN